MPSIYQIKPRSQALLRPLVRALAAAGGTANQVTVAAALMSIAAGIVLTFDGAKPLALLADLLDGGVAAGSFLPLPDTRLAAVMLFYALHGAVDAHIAAPVMTREALLAGVRSFCRRAVMRA